MLVNSKHHLLSRFFVLLVCGIFATGAAYAAQQDDERDDRDNRKTKQAQAVSKAVYDRIQKAQEAIDAESARALSLVCCGPGEYDQEMVAAVDEQSVLDGLRESHEFKDLVLSVRYGLETQLHTLATMMHVADSVIEAIEQELAALR